MPVPGQFLACETVQVVGVRVAATDIRDARTAERHRRTSDSNIGCDGQSAGRRTKLPSA